MILAISQVMTTADNLFEVVETVSVSPSMERDYYELLIDMLREKQLESVKKQLLQKQINNIGAHYDN